MITRCVRGLGFGLFATRWIAHPEIRRARWVSANGQIAFLLTRNCDGKGYPWRVTRIGVATGEPIGHSYGNDPNDAIENGLHSWGPVTLDGYR